MRKDVKLGLAVGGVLLAVLVAYVLVAPSSRRQAGSEPSMGEGSEAYANAVTGSGDAKAADPPGSDAARAAESGNTGIASRETTSTENAGATDAAGGTSSTGEKAAAGTAGGWNWDALVNGEANVPALMSPTEVSSNGPVSNAGAGGPLTASVNNAAGGGTNEIGLASAGGATGGLTETPTRQNVLVGAAPQQPPTQLQDSAQSPSAIPASGARTHVVKAGDTFSKISAAVYGNAKYYAQIERANPSIDATRLKPGTTIALPALEDIKPAASAAIAQAQTIDPVKEYKVQPNESLYSISVRLYGKPDRMEKLYELNKSTIGEDMAQVKVGTVLKLPEPPTQPTAVTSSR